jgi:hydrogenase maturation factor
VNGADATHVFVAELTAVERTPDGLAGTVSVRGARVAVALDLVPDVHVGDAVLVHAGLALARWRDERPWEEDAPCA